ncbi:MAG: hypothetical protein E7632_03080 [Ruminococcaceae bacterium]|nr:hypothetical protein [Oscillospiraceae bacterium]
MKTKVPHNVLTISEMTKRPNRINAEVLDIDNVVLTEEIIKKLRASRSMFNKSTYVQILCGGVRYNVEGLDRMSSGKYRLTLISPQYYATLHGYKDEPVRLTKLTAIS